MASSFGGTACIPNPLVAIKSMKKVILLIITVSFITIIYCQPNSHYKLRYHPGDTLISLAKSGIIIRSKPALESDKLGIVPFGEKLFVLNPTTSFDVIESRNGKWLKITYKGSEGYIFSGYVTTLKIQKHKFSGIDCYQSVFFEEFIKLNLDTLICKGHNCYSCGDVRLEISYDWEIYANRTQVTYQVGEDWDSRIIESYDITMNDLLNLMDYFIFRRKQECTKEDLSYNEDVGTIPELIITKGADGSISKLEYEHVGFYAESQAMQKVLVILTTK